MLNSIWVRDQTSTGIELTRVELNFQSPVVSVGELLQKRMQHEQRRIALNDQTEPLPHFSPNGFYIRIGDRRVVNLDEEFVVVSDDDVSFVENIELSRIFSLN